MNNAPNRWIASLFLAGMLAIIAFGGSRAARQAPQGANVIVANPTTQPVPVSVQGSPTVKAQPYGTYNVQVTGTPTVHAEQAGAYNVQLVGNPTVAATQSGQYFTHLVGTSPVSVSNTSANPVPVQEQSTSYLSAFQVTGYDTIPAGVSYQDKIVYTVPAGQRFVVETIGGVSASNTAGNQPLELDVSAGVGGGFADVTLAYTGVGNDCQGTITGSPLFIAEAGQMITVEARRSPGNESDWGNANYNIAGHLIPDAQSPKRLP